MRDLGEPLNRKLIFEKRFAQIRDKHIIERMICKQLKGEKNKGTLEGMVKIRDYWISEYEKEIHYAQKDRFYRCSKEHRRKVEFYESMITSSALRIRSVINQFSSQVITRNFEPQEVSLFNSMIDLISKLP